MNNVFIRAIAAMFPGFFGPVLPKGKQESKAALPNVQAFPPVFQPSYALGNVGYDMGAIYKARKNNQRNKNQKRLRGMGL